jgi:hypothetical protein
VREVISGRAYSCDPNQDIKPTLIYFACSGLRPEIIDIGKQLLIDNFDDDDYQ